MPELALDKENSMVNSKSPQRWLKDFLDLERFAAVMKKYSVWHPGGPAVIMADKISMLIALPIC